MTPDTLLLRQVAPAFVQNGEPSRQAFKPTQKDKIDDATYHLSVYNGDKFTPRAAFEHYAQKLGLASAGTLGVTVSECEAASTSAIEDNEPFDGHCAIAFKNLSNNQIDKAAKKLKDAAMKRGWLYKPL